MFTSSIFSTISEVIFALLLALGAFLDIRARRIPNLLALTLAVLGLVYTMIASPNIGQVWWSFAGIGTGLAIWVPFYLLGMLGAGDVKFFAGASAWLGPKVALSAATFAAMSGGVLALIWVLRSMIASRSAQASTTSINAIPAFQRVAPTPHSLPYGVAMVIGIGIALCFPHFMHVGR